MDTLIIDSGVLSKYNASLSEVKNLYIEWLAGFSYKPKPCKDSLLNFLEMLSRSKTSDLGWWKNRLAKDIETANAYNKAVEIHKENGTYEAYMRAIRKESEELNQKISEKLYKLFGL